MPEPTSRPAETGRLYVFEGIDGSGKTTQVRLTSANLTAKGIKHAIVEMPGRSRLSFEIRETLTRLPDGEVSETTEALLHLAMIRNGLEKFVMPALAEGRHVLMDRSYLSTAAYQGSSNDSLFETILDSAKSWLSLLRPNQIFYFDLDPQAAAERIRLRGDDPDKYDDLPISVKSDVRKRYLSLQEHFPGLFNVVDASMNVARLSEQVMEVIENDIQST